MNKIKENVMNNVYIPRVGSNFRLCDDWTFNVFNDSRQIWDNFVARGKNSNIIEKMGYGFPVNDISTEKTNKLEKLYSELRSIRTKNPNKPWESYVSTENAYRYKEIKKEITDIENSSICKFSLTLKKGTILYLSKMHNKKAVGANLETTYEGFPSMTFKILSCDDELLKNETFWAKLSDCNNMVIEEMG